MADNSAELMVHVRREWPINRPQVYHPCKDENLCLSILGLVHLNGNLVSWFCVLQIVYIHLPWLRESFNSQPGNVSTKEKSVPNSKNE